jgi:hypothetical protein
MFRAQLNFFGSEKFGVVLAIGIILVGCGEVYEKLFEK